MLRRLSVTNFVLIEQLELPLDKGLTIITGETGSGKSILIGALGLVMGERADTAVVRDPAKRCIIELEVDLRNLGLEEWFAAAELPYEPVALLRRQIDPGGRSRAFINDTPVRLEQLRELGGRSVHVHSQHHTLLLNDPRFQLGMLDHAAGARSQYAEYQACYASWKSVHGKLVSMRDEEARAKAELDYLQFQLDELDEAALKPDEQAGLERELERAEHSEELLHGLQAVEEGLDGGGGVLALLARLKQALIRPARTDAEILTLLERLSSAQIELKDISDEASSLSSRAVLDPREAERKRERLDLLLRLQKKHRLDGVDALILLREDLRQRTGEIGSMSDRIAVLELECAELEKRMGTAASELSKARVAALHPLSERIRELLSELGMPHAAFRFDHEEVPPGPTGTDRIRALFSANKDLPPAPLDKVASGGELGRVMLALIGLTADSMSLPTVVFDEIDTGVSGAVADRVGALMEKMARSHQVIAITHLPQIASKADTHLLVSKDQDAEVVQSMIRPLDAEERVNTLAQMLSGRRTTKAALQNARELLKGK